MAGDAEAVCVLLEIASLSTAAGWLPRQSQHVTRAISTLAARDLRAHGCVSNAQESPAAARRR